MTTTSITRDAAELNKLITKAVKAHKTSNEAVQDAFVSAVLHAAVHGQPKPLNTLFAGLTTNYQTAARQTLDKVTAQAAHDAGIEKDEARWIKFSTKTSAFEIVSGKNDLRQKTVVPIVEKILAVYDDENVRWFDNQIVRRFFDRNTIAAMMEGLKDADILKAIRKVYKDAMGEGTRPSAVSDKLKKALKKDVEEIERMVGANADTDAIKALEDDLQAARKRIAELEGKGGETSKPADGDKKGEGARLD